MPKMKTHKSLTKRFRLTGSGAVIAQNANRGHRKRFKSSRAIQKSTQLRLITGKVAKNVKKVMGL